MLQLLLEAAHESVQHHVTSVLHLQRALELLIFALQSILLIECLLQRMLAVTVLRLDVTAFYFFLQVHLLESLRFLPFLLDFSLKGPHLGLSFQDSLATLL